MTTLHPRSRLMLAGLLTFALPSFADQRTDSGLYVSGGVGVSTIDSNLSLEDDNGFAPRVSAGWQLTPHFGVEATYHNFEEAKDPFGSLSKFDTNGSSLAGTLRLPLSERLALFARLGSIWWETELTDTNCSRGPAGCITTEYNIDDTSGFLGVGVGFELTSMLELELSYDNFDFNFDGPMLNGFDHETTVMGLSLKLKF